MSPFNCTGKEWGLRSINSYLTSTDWIWPVGPWYAKSALAVDCEILKSTHLITSECLVYVRAIGKNYKRVGHYKFDSEEHSLNSLPLLRNKLKFSIFFTWLTCYGTHYLHYLNMSHSLLHMNLISPWTLTLCGHVTWLINEMWQNCRRKFKMMLFFAPFSHSSVWWLAKIQILAVLSSWDIAWQWYRAYLSATHNRH